MIVWHGIGYGYDTPGYRIQLNDSYECDRDSM